MSLDTIAQNAYRACVERREDSINDILESFNRALDMAGIQARYIQIQEEYATWQANDEREKDLAVRFYNQLTSARSVEEVKDLIRTYRKELGRDG